MDSLERLQISSSGLTRQSAVVLHPTFHILGIYFTITYPPAQPMKKKRGNLTVLRAGKDVDQYLLLLAGVPTEKATSKE